MLSEAVKSDLKEIYDTRHDLYKALSFVWRGDRQADWERMVAAQLNLRDFRRDNRDRRIRSAIRALHRHAIVRAAWQRMRSRAWVMVQE